jgi:hypothetical protein
MVCTSTAANTHLVNMIERLLTGLTIAPAAFQAEMNKLCGLHLNKLVCIYIDDLIFS